VAHLRARLVEPATRHEVSLELRNNSHRIGVHILFMRYKWLLLSALTLLAIAVAIRWLGFSRRVAFLTLDRHVKIEVNGAAVAGEILRNGATAIVTRRDSGRGHSYQLFFEGDVDFTGDTGWVVDCHEWVAPNFPYLLATRSYPPCRFLLDDGPSPPRLLIRGKAMQFVAKDGSIIRIVMPR
jgi:hypothetical protein